MNELKCRLETVNLRKIHSIAKVVGTVVTVSGAMVMTLYKGPALQIIKGQAASQHNSSTTDSSEQNWVLGTLMLISSCGGWASFFILQVCIHFYILINFTHNNSTHINNHL